MTPCLLAVFAHPDDEGVVGGTLAVAAANGARVVLACATRGEVGEISDSALATPATLGQVREGELRAACAALGVDELRFLGYRDSGMAGTPENDDPRCYHQADPEAATRQLVSLMREVRPQVVVTFEPAGGYGHPDHIAVSRYTTAAFDRAGDPQAFPEVGPAWQPRRLYYAALPRSWFKEMRDRMQALGVDTTWGDRFDEDEDESDSVDDQITHSVDVAEAVDAKLAAYACHRTQFGADHPFRQIPADVMRDSMAREHFIQARPAPVSGGGIVRVRDLLGEFYA